MKGKSMMPKDDLQPIVYTHFLEHIKKDIQQTLLKTALAQKNLFYYTGESEKAFQKK